MFETFSEKGPSPSKSFSYQSCPLPCQESLGRSSVESNKRSDYGRLDLNSYARDLQIKYRGSHAELRQLSKSENVQDVLSSVRRSYMCMIDEKT